MKRIVLFFTLILAVVTLSGCTSLPSSSIDSSQSEESSSSSEEPSTTSEESSSSSIIQYTPTINVPSSEIVLTVGDKLDLLAGVTATGTQNEDVTSRLEVLHQIPVDENGFVTTSGIYEAQIFMEIEGVDYFANLSVTINDLPIPDIITNGDFETGSVTPFSKSDFEGAGSTLEVVDDGNSNKVMQLVINAVSWNAASPRVEYIGFSLDSAKKYELSFDAYALKARAMHVQLGELVVPAAEPWFMAALAETRYFNVTTEKQTFTWSFQPDSSVANADLTNLSLLFEFGTMANGGTSVATTVFMDNIQIIETDEVEQDTTAPILSQPTQAYFYVETIFNPLTYVSAIDEKGIAPTITIVEAESTLPPVDANNKLTTPGFYVIVYQASDLAGNVSRVTWNFEVKEKPPVVNGFNLISFAAGGESSLSEDTITGFVWSKTNDAVIEYGSGILKVTSHQDATNDPWEATQIFARSVRVSGAGKYTLSFDIQSDVAGYIEANGNAYRVEVGTTHIAIEKYMFNYNFVTLSIQLGVYKGLQLPGGNIGPCTVYISNISNVKTTTGPDVIAPIITLKQIKTYFVGDAFDLMSTVKIYDYRDSKAVITLDSANSQVPPVDANGLLTTAGVYTVTFIGTDATGNTRNFTTYYTVREPLVNYNGFSFEKIQYGTQAELDDPSVIFVWNDNDVHTTYRVVDHNNFVVTSDQQTGSDKSWYATQLFLKSLPVATKGLYTISYDIVSNVAGAIKLNDELVQLVVGSNHIEKKIAFAANTSYTLSLQFGKEEFGNMGPFEAAFQNMSLTYVEQPAETTWEGYGMSVMKIGTDSIITYNNIPDPWYTVNARTYQFNTSENCQAVVISFKGTVGHTYTFKFEGIPSSIFESTSIMADGTVQRVIIDTRNRTTAQRVLLHNLLVFCENVGASGGLIIYGYEMHDNFADCFDTNWYGMGGAKVVDVDTTSTVTFTNVPTSWWNMNAQTPLKNYDPNNTTISFNFKGAVGLEYLFKVEGGGYSKELSVIATGETQTLVLDVSSITLANRSKLALAVVFCKTSGSSGDISIYSYQ